MMAAWGLHLDFPPDVAGGALFPYLECMVNQSFGMVIGQGGADTIVKAMVGALKTRGGTLILGDPVVRIDVSSGRADRRYAGRRASIGSKARRHRQRAPQARIRIAGRSPMPSRKTFERDVSAIRAGPGDHDDPPRA